MQRGGERHKTKVFIIIITKCNLLKSARLDAIASSPGFGRANGYKLQTPAAVLASSFDSPIVEGRTTQAASKSAAIAFVVMAEQLGPVTGAQVVSQDNGLAGGAIPVRRSTPRVPLLEFFGFVASTKPAVFCLSRAPELVAGDDSRKRTLSTPQGMARNLLPQTSYLVNQDYDESALVGAEALNSPRLRLIQ